MNLKTLLKFNEIANISSNGDYEAHSEDGVLTAHIAHFTCTGILSVRLKVDKQLDIYTSYSIFKKYLDIFSSEIVDINTNDDCIIVWDEDTEVTIPMLDQEAAKRQTRKMKKTPDYGDATIIKIPSQDIKDLISTSKKLDEMHVIFDMSDMLYLKVKNKVSKKYKNITGKPHTWYLANETLLDMIRNASGDLTFTLPSNVDVPYHIEYGAGPITVEVYLTQTTVEQ